jgi:LmbE family N-acetylglucosaminyl deacetylase
MRYLFLSSHTDDSEVCAGGTMAKLIDRGCDVTHIAASYCGNDLLPPEFARANRVLGVSKYYTHNHEVRKFNTTERGAISNLVLACRDHYDFVFTNSVSDRHPDHRTIGEESLRIFNCNLVTFIGSWNGNEDPNYFIELSQEQLDRKIAALSCYKSQAHRPYMDKDFIKSWAVYNGVKCGKKYAEAFRVVKLVREL